MLVGYKCAQRLQIVERTFSIKIIEIHCSLFVANFMPPVCFHHLASQRQNPHFESHIKLLTRQISLLRYKTGVKQTYVRQAFVHLDRY